MRNEYFMKNNGYRDYVLDLLAPFGPIRARAMFGGHGIYKDGIFFALIAEDILYFKVDDQNRPAYQAAGSKPFTYEGKNGKPIAMSYWELPVDVLEDHDHLGQWVNEAVAAARRSKK